MFVIIDIVTVICCRRILVPLPLRSYFSIILTKILQITSPCLLSSDSKAVEVLAAPVSLLQVVDGGLLQVVDGEFTAGGRRWFTVGGGRWLTAGGGRWLTTGGG